VTPPALRMAPRDPREPHRVASPLELLFDLCFVVAVAQASAHLHSGLTGAHFVRAIAGYLVVFFGIWWAWMNFTWFASAYDPDDVLYRLAVLVQIFGVLVLAAGVPRAFEHRDLSVTVAGYVIMRMGLVSLWLRAAASDPEGRRTALRYAAGVSTCQVGWILLLALAASPWWLAGWLVLAAAEMLVPVWAERARPTPWHPHHIAERFGLLTLIVLGESVTSATVAIQSAITGAAITPGLFVVIASGVLIVFSMWWLYFDQPAHHLLVDNHGAFVWGYGHLVVFASTAAVGAGLAAATDYAIGRSRLSLVQAVAVVAIPAACYLASVWVLVIGPLRRPRG